MLFNILQNYDLKEVLINDINEQLITTYNVVKNDINDLVKNLYAIRKSYLSYDDLQDRKAFYNRARDMYNNIMCDFKQPLKIATLFIFLNKACFRGKYSVNKYGIFNNSFSGRLDLSPNLIDNIVEVSKILQNIKIISGDYRQCEKFINKNTFVYLDPPYLQDGKKIISEYHKDKFELKQQKELKTWIDKLTVKGAYIMMSNSNVEVFHKVYKDYNIDVVNVAYEIGNTTRKKSSEIILTNY